METTNQDLRREMVETCRQMNATGINQGTAGNLSVRFGDGFLITPSSLPYDRMQPDDLVEMAFDGTYVGRRPSSEWRFHRDILARRADVDAVLHNHATYATTLACHERGIPPFHYMTAVAGGHDGVLVAQHRQRLQRAAEAGLRGAEHVALAPLAAGGVELGVDPLHAGEVQPGGDILRHEAADQLLDHQRVREEAVVQAVGGGHRGGYPVGWNSPSLHAPATLRKRRPTPATL